MLIIKDGNCFLLDPQETEAAMKQLGMYYVVNPEERQYSCDGYEQSLSNTQKEKWLQREQSPAYTPHQFKNDDDTQQRFNNLANRCFDASATLERTLADLAAAQKRVDELEGKIKTLDAELNACRTPIHGGSHPSSVGYNAGIEQATQLLHNAFPELFGVGRNAENVSCDKDLGVIVAGTTRVDLRDVYLADHQSRSTYDIDEFVRSAMFAFDLSSEKRTPEQTRLAQLVSQAIELASNESDKNPELFGKEQDNEIQKADD